MVSFVDWVMLDYVRVIVLSSKKSGVRNRGGMAKRGGGMFEMKA